MSDGAYKDGGPLRGELDLTQPMELDQLFDGTNSPITQIDEIAISKVSHRNANRQLVAAKPERYGIKPPPPRPAAGRPRRRRPAGPGRQALLPTAWPASAPEPASRGGTAPAASTKTANYSIERNRYLIVTDQSRHLPLAVTLTIDQSHLHEVLAAFANSKLRFQTTQVEFRRVPAAAPAASSRNPAAPGGPNPNGGGPMPPPMTPLIPPRAAPGRAGAARRAGPPRRA